MRKCLFALVVLFYCAASVFADINVDKKNHMQNMKPGRCAWCSLETMGRTIGWPTLNGCVLRNNRDAQREDIVTELNTHNVRYRVQWPERTEYFYHVIFQSNDGKPLKWLGVRRNKEDANALVSQYRQLGYYWIDCRLHWNTSFLKECLDAGLPVAVSMDNIQPTDFSSDPKHRHSRHMAVLVGMDNETVRIVDSNWKPGRIRRETLAWFVTRWNGFAVALEKP